MFRLNHIFFVGLVFSIFLLFAKQAFSQQHMAAATSGVDKVMSNKEPAWTAQSMDKMLEQMHSMMDRSANLVEHMPERSSMGMMHNQNQHGMMMDHGDDWQDMMHGTDNMLKNMNQMLEQMDNIMNDENLMKDPQIKDRLEDMLQNMSMMMQPMEGFLHNAKDIQKLSETPQENAHAGKY